ncbi:MAG TPA: DNA adenine methylase [Anaeromyxobacteraceae bacterium]|nr:DNA adenine methylase [Anaeromyxobacteraceae bacterium]
MKPTRPALRYHGGKFRAADWIAAHFPPHRIYVEPYGGAASVLLQKPRSFAEVYNDVDEEIVAFFRVLRDPTTAAQLRELLELTPFARRELELAFEPSPDPVEQARRTLVKAYMGFGSDAVHRPGPRGMRLAVSTNREKHAGTTGFRLNRNQNGAHPARDWSKWPEQVPAFVARLRDVAIECRPALDVIRLFDKPDTLFYLDPPYVHSTRTSADRNGYRHEMSDDDHRELAAWARSTEAAVVISGYASELYDEELYPDWKRVTRKAYADARRQSSDSVAGPWRTEVLWISPTAAARGTLTLFAGEHG